MFFAFIFCKHKNGGCMNDILRAVVQSAVFPELLEEKRVTFEKIPAESEALYDADIQRLRQVTEVITTNSDSDKEQGLLKAGLSFRHIMANIVRLAKFSVYCIN